MRLNIKSLRLEWNKRLIANGQWCQGKSIILGDLKQGKSKELVSLSAFSKQLRLWEDAGFVLAGDIRI